MTPSTQSDTPAEVHRVALRLAAGFDPWAPDGPQNETEWDLCAAGWREVARRCAVECQRLRARIALLEGRAHPMDYDSPAYD